MACPVVHLAWPLVAPEPVRPLLEAARRPSADAEAVVGSCIRRPTGPWRFPLLRGTSPSNG
eukprot:6598132-Alexandrium_andersonii.AAC.1